MMADLSHVDTEELERELVKRGKTVSPAICWKCNIWPAKPMYYSEPGVKLHCLGCFRTCEKCLCG